MSDEASSARRLPLWLIASILVNVLLIGLIAGHLLGSKPGRGGSGGPGGPPEMRMAGAIVESAALSETLTRPPRERRRLRRGDRPPPPPRD